MIEDFFTLVFRPKVKRMVKPDSMGRALRGRRTGAGGDAAINGDVPEQPITLACEPLLRGILSRQMQLRRIAESGIDHIVKVPKLVAQKGRQFFRSFKALAAQRDHCHLSMLRPDVELGSFISLGARLVEGGRA